MSDQYDAYETKLRDAVQFSAGDYGVDDHDLDALLTFVRARAKCAGMAEQVDAHGCQERAEGYECPYLFAAQAALDTLMTEVP